MPQLESRLLVVTDRRQTNGRPLLSVLQHVMAAGPVAIQLRERDLPVRNVLSLARAVRAVTAARGSQLLINDRIDVALALDGVGVHLRSDSLPVDVARRLIGPNRLLGISVHSIDEAVEAERQGADYVVLGPIYDTPSKRSFGPPLGLSVLEATSCRVTIPVVAIGGMTASRARDARRAGAFGVAVIGAVFGASNVEAAARELLAAVTSDIA